MEVESIGAVLNNGSANPQQLGLGQEDFLQILLTQLTFQDPLEPLDNQDFIAQIAQFTGLEQERQANENINNLITINSANQSVGLLGRTVEINQDTGATVGQVTTVTFNQGVPSLTVQTTDGQFLTNINLSQINLIRI